ncbi:carboxymuconolactone decarboxylase family protein [Halomonas coralii]|nr:carboxymuconolactone decarboxylase family protein [Modicisalibacter sp. R2A 31.J]MBZ9575460.1 carboxymuconolactone decarboxylase family protein [Modicisalibacter sp. MOD 31.J]
METLRLPYSTLSADTYRHFLGAKTALENGPLDAATLELINLRVSQLNGCAFCTQMHAARLREQGIDNGKIDSIAGWRASRHFTSRERAALAWADALTRVDETAAPDETYTPLLAHFSETEVSDLTFAIALMNALNRIGVGMRL